MIRLFRKVLGRTGEVRQPASAPASTPAGTRVYAVGDIHGRLDLFQSLMRAIDRDDARRGPKKTQLVLLGDLIDRGPDSAGVVAMARELAQQRDVTLIMGNHEEMLLNSYTKAGILRSFMRHGGHETLLSYGLLPETLTRADNEELQYLLTTAIPAEDRAFLAGFEKMVRVGDYVFVHAGVRPNTPLEMQTGQDCRWIREPFLSHDGDFGGVVVHGHTVTQEPELRANRIGIDTGAFTTGTLTAVGLEGTDRWLIQASEQDNGQIASFARAA